jgi:hypothetical protein
MLGMIFCGKTKNVGGCSVYGMHHSVMALAICTWLEVFSLMNMAFSDVLT